MTKSPIALCLAIGTRRPVKRGGLARLSPFPFRSCCYILAFADQFVGVTPSLAPAP